MRLDRLTPERWQQIRAIASMALDAAPEDREAILDAKCEGDRGLRAAVLQVLRDFSGTDDLFGCPPPLRAGAGWRPDDRIGAYRIVRELGHGGMGCVYLAERDDGAFRLQVAIKLIPRHGGRRLFQREREILARLDHPGIARLLDGGTAEDGSPYLVMEYVDGVPLTDFARDLPIDQKLGLALQVCDSIRYAHQNLVIHRDLKPTNILVTAAGRPKVLDFGVSKLIEEGDGGESAVTHAIMTPAWASPEQRSGAPVTTLTDVYALGLILYRVLTGVMPAPGGAVPLPSRTVPALKGDLDSILLKALEPEPARRYQSVEQLAGDIGRYLTGEPVEARQGTWWYRTRKLVRRRKVQVAGGTALLLAVTLGGAGTLIQKRRAERRFQDVESLAKAVMFDYQDDLERLPGATAIRARIARDAVQYLDRISEETGASEDLRRRTALAYRKVGEVQGYGRVANLGDVTGAVGNLSKSEAILGVLAGRHPADPGLRLDLAITQERLANTLSLSGRNTMALAAAERSIATLDGLTSADAWRERAAAWREYSTVAGRQGQGKRAIEAARRAVDCLSRIGPGHREDRAWAYERLAQALASGERLNEEALAAGRSALDLYGQNGEDCGARDLACRTAWLAALEQFARLYVYAGRLPEAVAISARIEREAAELAARDPNDRLVLRALHSAQHAQGHSYQSLGRTADSLRKFEQAVETAGRIAGSDPQNIEGTCLIIHSRAKLGEMLVQRTGRVADAEAQLREAMRLSSQIRSDSLSCLDFRKIAVINLARVAEKKGDWRAGREWRQETVRTARRVAAQMPGEPLGMIIEAGANFELALGDLEAAAHGDRASCLLEAREALGRALQIYGSLEAMGNPLQYQYNGWPERARAMLKKVEDGIREL